MRLFLKIIARRVSCTMIKYFTDKTVDYNLLINLFNQAGWNDKTEEIGRLKVIVENSQIVVTA
ncbi:hypothetical protein [uncultured Clostridium sp.]|uniref:hypothetical protein n=1 Tax=uncultured Clostridium sp. TaxID=59620 RepID=UPI0028F012D2|nr:hypothetical protein [uncultured Clostridium sp.]